MKFPTRSVLAALVLAPAAAATAGTTVSPAPEPEISAPAESGWQFTLGLYGWAAGLDGTIGAAGYTTDVGVSFSDILDTLDMTAMGAFELRNGPWMFQFEGLYLKNSDAVSGVDSAGTPFTAKLTAETTRLEPVVGYRVVDNGTTKVDLLAGAVYYDISNKLVVTSAGAVAGGKSQDNWLDPIIGARVHHHFAEKWSILARGDIGGFGVNADLVWQLSGLVGYDITDRVSAYAGYRHAAVDYRNGAFVYDAAASGPILGMAISF